MENLVPLGTGNSRLMKSNIPSNTTLAQIIQMWNNGTFPYDIGPLNSAGISQQGTPLNKDTLLKDTTAALYGLDNTAVPDDVLAKLAEAAFVEDGAVTDIDGNPVGVQIATGSYVGTGPYGESNPNTLTFDFKPSLVIIAPSSTNYPAQTSGIYIWGNALMPTISANEGVNNIVNVDGNTMTWYAAGNFNASQGQFNIPKITYYYIALGTGG